MKIKYLLFIVCLLMSIGGCSKEQTMIFTPDDIEKIKLILVDKHELDDGISYSINLVNNSDYVIKQNSIFVYYQIKTENGSKGSGYKVEVQGNKLDIQPSEEVRLNVFTPFEGMGDRDKLEEYLYVDMKGYLEKVEDSHSFGKIGAFDEYLISQKNN